MLAAAMSSRVAIRGASLTNNVTASSAKPRGASSARVRAEGGVDGARGWGARADDGAREGGRGGSGNEPRAEWRRGNGWKNYVRGVGGGGGVDGGGIARDGGARGVAWKPYGW